MAFFTENDTKSALEAQYAAQQIAFAPIIFQVARSMRDLGILELLHAHNKTGLTQEDIVQKTSLTPYAIKVLLETSLSADIVKCNDETYFITKTGYFLFNDEMTKTNMNYNHDVNYEGLFHLDACLKEEKPVGLQKVFGEYETIYPALSTLPKKAKESWFAFDHFYSDSALDEATNIVLETKPSKVLDIGGNTGKFSMAMSKKSKDVTVTIVDLPEQITLAKENIHKNNLEKQVDFYPMNLFDSKKILPKNYDIIWMSQFLDCFKEEDIVAILKKAKAAMGENTTLCIMEPLWDKQRFETSAYCIINTSPYFTAMANGYSKMFNYVDIKSYINQAGLKIVTEHHDVGICQSILMCK